jgi:hypothetical protein
MEGNPTHISDRAKTLVENMKQREREISNRHRAEFGKLKAEWLKVLARLQVEQLDDETASELMEREGELVRALAVLPGTQRWMTADKLEMLHHYLVEERCNDGREIVILAGIRADFGIAG